jgi:exodeoxyribonuclease VII large subunit
MSGRHVSELSHALARTARGMLGFRGRRLQALERQLATFDAGRRLAVIRARLVSADSRLEIAVVRRRERGRSQLHAVVGRLESLSPLAVLGRGYAVAWSADRTRILRDAASVAPGDAVRVTLAHGELECDVRRRTLPPR